MKRTVFFALVLVSLFTVAAYSAGLSKLDVADVSEPISLDPHIGNDSVTSTAIGLVNQGLLDRVDGDIEPGLAESFSVSEDGTVYTFKLRDAKWSDGVPLTAQQFVDTYVRMLTRKDAMDLAYLIFPIKNAQPISEGKMEPAQLGCKALDEKTLEITLEGAFPFMKALFASTPFFPIRTDLVEKWGADYGNDADKIVSIGPFVLKEWAHRDKLVFAKNPNFWNADKVKIDEITMHFIVDANTLKNMYDTGGLSFLTVPLEQLKSFEGKPGFEYYNSGSVTFLCLSQKGTSEEKGKIIKNRNFVNALSLAIDREDFVKALYPTSTPLTGVVNPEISDQMGGQWKDSYTAENKYHKVKADIEAAKASMEKACKELGYASAADMPTFEFITIEGELNRTVCEYFQNIWNKTFGLKVDIILLAYAQYWDHFYGAPYDFARSGWGPDYDDPFTYLDMWDSRGGWNKTGWVGENYYKLITEANKQPDMKKRNDVFYDAEALLLQEAPIIPLLARREAFIINKDKVNGVAHYMFAPYFDFRYATVK